LIHRNIPWKTGLFLAEEKSQFDDGEQNEKADWHIRDVFRVFSIGVGPA